MARYFDISGIRTSIDDSDSYGIALCNYFANEELDSKPDEFDFIVRMAKNAEDLKIDAQYTAVSGRFRFNPDEYSVRNKYYSYSVKHLFTGGTPELAILWTRKGTPVNALRDRVRNKTIGVGSNEEKFLETIMNYSMFWYILAVILLRNGKCFVHSSIFSTPAGAQVIAGSAGCGKTSTLLKAMETAENGYVDEDFGILGSDGCAHYIAKRVTVYEEDAAFGSEIIKKALKTLSRADKNSWKFYGAAGVNMRYKFHPEVIFPKQVVKSVPIDSVVFVSRSSAAEPVKKAVSAELLAEKMMNVSFRELKEMYELLNNIRGVGDEEIRRNYPPIRDLEDQYTALMTGILTGSRHISCVETPFKAGPIETLACIMGEIK